MMTRDEARRVLTQMRDWDIRPQRYNDALDVALAALDRLEALEQEIRSVPSPIDEVTAGATPLRDGGMSPPLWHCHCHWCGERWSIQRWKRDKLMDHPENACLWYSVHALTLDALTKETP